MRFRSLLILAMWMVPATAAEPEAGSDLSKIQGCWEASIGKKREMSVTLEVKGNNVSATIKPKRGPRLKASGELQLDPKVSPRSLDWINFSTPDGIEVPKILSIYRLEGDKLIVRSGGFNDARPRSFESGGEGIWTDEMVFTRPASATTAKTSTGTAGR